MHLYMILLGALPPGRKTEQHDFFFGISANLAALRSEIIACWPEAERSLHVDAWRKVTYVDGYNIQVIPVSENNSIVPERLFFINLGGYRRNELMELHYQVLCVAADKADAARIAKQSAFYKHTGFKGAPSHVDDKYGIDVDDAFAIEDILPAETKKRYKIKLTKTGSAREDEIHSGYITLNKLLSVQDV